MIFLYLIILLLICYFSIGQFIKIAKNRNIVAVGNNKTLHQGIVPRGAGVAFGFIYIIFLVFAFLEKYLGSEMFYSLLIGSSTCLLLGFIDDIYDLNIITKICIQSLIIIFLLYYFFYDYYLVMELNNLYKLIIFVFTTLSIVWILNAYNFLDGADGHLSSVSLMQCFLLFITIYINRQLDLVLPIVFLFSIMVVFLKYNWFPAKVFMGDAGSLFVGINLIAFTIISIKYAYITPYILFIIYSYFLIDTLGTLVIRTFLKKKWKNRHRSHPYQNYSKKYGHNKMSLLVIAYHTIWLLPIMLFAIFFSHYQIILSIISIIPSIIFLIRYGPLFSSE